MRRGASGHNRFFFLIMRKCSLVIPFVRESGIFLARLVITLNNIFQHIQYDLRPKSVHTILRCSTHTAFESPTIYIIAAKNPPTSLSSVSVWQVSGIRSCQFNPYEGDQNVPRTSLTSFHFAFFSCEKPRSLHVDVPIDFKL